MMRIELASFFLALLLTACVRHEDIRAVTPLYTADMAAGPAPVPVDSVDFNRKQDTLFFINSGLSLSIPLQDLVVDLSGASAGTLSRNYPDSLARVYFRFALMLDLLRDSLVEVRFVLKGRNDSVSAVLTVERDSAWFEIDGASQTVTSAGVLSATLDKQWLQLSLEMNKDFACFREESEPALHLAAPLRVFAAPGSVGALVIHAKGHVCKVHFKNIRIYE